MLERLFSNRTAYRQLQHAAQSGLQDGTSNESAGLKDLDTNQFVLVVEFDSDVRSDLNAAASFSLAGPQSSYCRQIVAALLLHTKATMFRRTVCRSCKVWATGKNKSGVRRRNRCWNP